MDNDLLLLRRIRHGDENAADTFVRKYYPDILRYCRFHTASQEDAEDLTQETFVRFFAKLSEYQHQGKARNYLYTIAANLCRNAWARRHSAPLDNTAIESLGSAAEDPEVATVTHLMLEQALNALPPEQREVIILHYYQGLKQREIAAVLSISLPLVKYRLRQAKQHLEDHIGKEEDTP